MFEFLQQIEEGIYARYLTVEKNIKGASNSFYDSYLDLQEHFLKTAIQQNSISIGPHESCGALLKRREVKELFLNKCKVDAKVYDKMGDCTKKANEHKHEKEKNIAAETVAAYMKVFYTVSAGYAATRGLTVPQFNKNYFSDMFGSSAKIDDKLDEILQAVNKLSQQEQSAQKPAVYGSQNREQARQGVQPAAAARNDTLILKNFIANAEKKYFWFGTKSQFKNSKTVLACIQIALIATGILSTVITSVCLKIYSTFTLFENLVAIQTVILLAYTLLTKKLYNDYKLAAHTPDIFVPDGDNIWRESGGEKKRYKWLRRISYVAVVCNIVCIWTTGSGVIRIFATVFELAFLALTVASVFVRINHYCMYCDLFISGRNASGAQVTIVHSKTENRLFSLEEYSRRYSDFL